MMGDRLSISLSRELESSISTSLLLLLLLLLVFTSAQCFLAYEWSWSMVVTKGTSMVSKARGGWILAKSIRSFSTAFGSDWRKSVGLGLNLRGTRASRTFTGTSYGLLMFFDGGYRNLIEIFFQGLFHSCSFSVQVRKSKGFFAHKSWGKYNKEQHVFTWCSWAFSSGTATLSSQYIKGVST